MSDITILLVEDHKLIRVGIKTLFDEADGFNVVAETDSGKKAVSIAKELNPDIVILDIGLPDIHGTKVIQQMKEKEIKSKIIVLSASLNEEDISKCLSLGVFAYVVKDINTDNLLNIVKTVHEGAMWLDPKIVPFLRNKNETIIPNKPIKRAKFRETHFNLTQREYEVLKLIVDGKSNIDIANELCISEHTAKAHVCNIIQKLVVDDRTQAAVKALKEGIVN